MDEDAAAADDAFNRAMDDAPEDLEELEAAAAMWDRLIASVPCAHTIAGTCDYC